MGAAIAGIVLTAFGRPAAALVLTATAAVAMINAFWLEDALVTILQPGRLRMTTRAAGLLVSRVVLWGLLFGGLWVLRSHVELWAVAAGLALYLVALAVAGARAQRPSPGEE